MPGSENIQNCLLEDLGTELKQGKLTYQDGSEYIGGLKVVEGRKMRHGLGVLNREKGKDGVLYKYEGPWTADCMGDGPGELLMYAMNIPQEIDDRGEEED